MAVQSGLGATTLDYLCCVGGMFVGIETKREGGKPTPRQETVIENIVQANGQVFIITNDVEIEVLRNYLQQHTSHSKEEKK